MIALLEITVLVVAVLIYLDRRYYREYYRQNKGPAWLTLSLMDKLLMHTYQDVLMDLPYKRSRLLDITDAFSYHTMGRGEEIYMVVDPALPDKQVMKHHYGKIEVVKGEKNGV